MTVVRPTVANFLLTVLTGEDDKFSNNPFVLNESRSNMPRERSH